MLSLPCLSAVCLALGGGHADLHPAGPNFYLELPDTQGVLDAYQDTALYRLLHDEEIRVLAAKLSGEDPESFDVDEIFFERLEELYAEQPQLLLVQALFGDIQALSFSVTGVELHGMGLLLSSSDFEWTPELDEHLAPLQLRLVLEFPGEDEQVLGKMFDTMTALLPIEGGERSFESAQVASLGRALDLTVWRSPEWLGREIFAARDGARVVFGAGVDAAAKFTRSEASLATDERFAHCGAAFEEPTGVVLYDSYSHIDGISELGVLLAAQEDVPPGVTAAVHSALGLLIPGDRIEKRSRSRLVEGRFVTECASRNYPGTVGLGDVVGQSPVTASSFELVPEKAVAVWATTVDKTAMGDFLEHAIAETTGADPALFLAELEDNYELNPKRDIIDSLGESLVFYTMPFAGIGAPKMFVALDLTNPEAFAKGLEQLGETLAAVPGGAVEFRAKPYRKSPFMSFAPGDSLVGGSRGVITQMAPALFSPRLAIGVLDSRAIVSLSNIYTKREMKRLKSGEGAVHALATQQDALPEGVVSYGMTDWGEILDSLYGAVQGMLPLVQQATGGELPFDLDDLPGDDLFSRYIAPTHSWSRKKADGTYSYNESSFGPEIPLIVSGALVGALWIAVSEETIRAEITGVPEDIFEEGSSAVQVTREALSSVKVGIVVYQSDLGHLPASLAELVKPSTNFPDGYLDGPHVPHDGWGNSLLYELREDGSSFRVWSSGPNGADDGGVGDDVNLGHRR